MSRHAPSRFRVNPARGIEAEPRVTGLCNYCRRSMWAGIDGQDRNGRALQSTDPGVCWVCKRLVDRDIDPTTRQNAAAYRLPPERPEADPAWRSGAACVGVDPTVFEPEPDDAYSVTRDERDDLWETRRYTAQNVCADCPVRVQCREAADANGYSGLWGRRFYDGRVWVDLVTGARGPTLYALPNERDKILDRLAREGFTPDGEVAVPAEGGTAA